MAAMAALTILRCGNCVVWLVMFGWSSSSNDHRSDGTGMLLCKCRLCSKLLCKCRVWCKYGHRAGRSARHQVQASIPKYAAAGNNWMTPCLLPVHADFTYFYTDYCRGFTGHLSCRVSASLPCRLAIVFKITAHSFVTIQTVISLHISSLPVRMFPVYYYISSVLIEIRQPYVCVCVCIYTYIYI